MDRKCLCLSALVLTATSVVSHALDETTTWIGTDGLWSDRANWTSGEPRPGDIAIIQNGGTARVSEGATIAGTVLISGSRIIVENVAYFTTAYGAYIGIADAPQGRMTITGAGSSWTGSYRYLDAPTVAVGSGSGSSGLLEILDGAHAELIGGLGAHVGVEGGTGAVTVSGADSVLSIHDSTFGEVLVLGSAPTPGGAVFSVSDGALAALHGRMVIGESGADGAMYLNGTTGHRGTLMVYDTMTFDGTGDLHFDGGVLRPFVSREQLMGGVGTGGLVVDAGGGFIDADYNFTSLIEIGISRNVSGTGVLVKTGAGKLTIQEPAIWANRGGISVEAGRLKVAGSVRPVAGADGTAGASGQAGSAAVTVTGSAELLLENGTPHGRIHGGAGGNGSFVSGTHGGNGGNGGAGVVYSSTVDLASHGEITGGNGGDGGGGNGLRTDTPGNGGDGGAGILLQSAATFTNSFGVYGGERGQGGTVVFDGGLNFHSGREGSGGAGIVVSGGGTVINGASGTISGGIGIVVSGGTFIKRSPGVEVTTMAANLVNSGVIHGGVKMGNFASRVTLMMGGVIAPTEPDNVFPMAYTGLDMGTSTSAVLTLDGEGTQLYSAAVVNGGTVLHGELVKENALGTWTIDATLADVAKITVNTGTLKPASLTSFGANNKIFTVNNGGTLDYATNEFRVGETGAGSLSIANGGLVTSAHGSVGSDGGGSGTATVAGTWTLTDPDSILAIGNVGHGELTLAAGGVLNVVQGRIGQAAAGTGIATISGTWNNSRNFIVGDHGAGTLTIEAGGVVNGNESYLGYGAGSSGTAAVKNGGTWANNGQLFVGGSGTGELTIEAGGIVVAPDGAQVGASTGSSGKLTIKGTAGNRGVLEAHHLRRGDGAADIHFDGGVLRATASGAVLRGFEGGKTVSDEGGMFVDSNGHDVTTSVAISGAGGFTKQGAGALRLDAAHSYQGLTTVEAGVLKLGPIGSIAGSSGINVATDATFDVVSVHMGFTLGASQTLSGTGTMAGNTSSAGHISPGRLSPGNSVGTLYFTDNLALLTGSEVFIEIASAASFDMLNLSHVLTYGGTLRVGFIDGYLPGLGSTFDLLEFGSRDDASAFDNIVFDTPGYTGNFNYGNGTLQIVGIPEPSTMALAILGLVGGAGALRRRLKTTRSGTFEFRR